MGHGAVTDNTTISRRLAAVDFDDALRRQTQASSPSAHARPGEKCLARASRIRDGFRVQMVFVRVRGKHKIGFQLRRQQRIGESGSRLGIITIQGI